MTLRIPPPALALGTGVLMWSIDRYLPGLRLLTPPWNWAGWVFIGIGCGIDAVSIAAFVQAKTTIDPIRVDRATHLVVSGLYRFSRNPMYLGLVMVLTGWALLLGSATPWLLIVGFERLLVIAQIQREEAVLTANFGDEYRHYARRVHRWIGRQRRG